MARSKLGWSWLNPALPQSELQQFVRPTSYETMFDLRGFAKPKPQPRPDPKSSRDQQLRDQERQELGQILDKVQVSLFFIQSDIGIAHLLQASLESLSETKHGFVRATVLQRELRCAGILLDDQSVRRLQDAFSDRQRDQLDLYQFLAFARRSEGKCQRHDLFFCPKCLYRGISSKATHACQRYVPRSPGSLVCVAYAMSFCCSYM